MNNVLANDVVKAIRQLYDHNPIAQKLFDLNAERERDASSSSLDVISRKLDISRGDAVALARALEEAGCGEFKVGRRGAPSRFEWSYSCIGLGKAAAGEPIALEQAEDPQDEDYDEDEAPTAGSITLTIPQAKAALARSLGISVDQIEIKISA
ncbi:hypothetical protein [Bradyrhizobium sp.]|uniref:hypothetical protein n=1 Tax=Bradyrhizobium sp. TaxID=376 RepID=UPI0039E4C0BB